MNVIRCKTCGGSVERRGNYYVCEWCGNKWEIDSANDVHVVDRANAWSALRDGDFEKAERLFEEIIYKDSSNHEAYWGRALAQNGIVYVTDISENKKVPTCNNITEDSFINNKDVQKALSMAPEDISESYKRQAEYIEKVRIEWLKKASKEPAYDVFISFKDSDRENGIERTQDSIDAQDLYNALVAEGYKVFFSRISLRDKISEQYEPYIYNAIKTAKVMVVFGEKPEYFSSVWIKNEWTRFKRRIEKGEKHKNSLVVVYKNMNPGDLPAVLRSRQCLNAADMTFLSMLNKHVKRVISETAQAAHLDRIEIKGGQIAKKASRIANESIQTREIGAGAIAETSISEKQQLDLVRSYIKVDQWEDASKIIDDIIFNNPSYSDAIWHQILIRHRAKDGIVLLNKLNRFTKEDFDSIEMLLSCASKDFAAEILDILYQSYSTTAEEVYLQILKSILSFNYENRAQKISDSFEYAITNKHFKVFNALLSTLNDNDVDAYIAYNLRFAHNTTISKQRLHCVSSVLAVDNGNIQALTIRLDENLDYANCETLISLLEDILKYSSNTNEMVLKILRKLSKDVSSEEQCKFAKQALKYYVGDLSNIKDLLNDLAFTMIGKQYFEEAQYFINLVLSLSPNDSKAYWGICLIKTKSTSEMDLIRSKTSIKQIPEYTKYLTLVTEARRQECFELAKNQEKAQAQKKSEKKSFIIRLITICTTVICVIGITVGAFFAISTAITNSKINSVRKHIDYLPDDPTLYLDYSQDIMRAYEEYQALEPELQVKVENSDKLLKCVESLKVADPQEIFNYLQFTATSDGYEISVKSDRSAELSGDIVIPSTYKDKPVTSIPNGGFENCTNITSIIIPDSVSTIGFAAFKNCSSITSITLPFVGKSQQASANESVFGYIFGHDWYNGTGNEPGFVNRQFGEVNGGTWQYTGIYEGYMRSFFYYIPQSIKSVTITNQTNIPDAAFNGCNNLTAINYTNGITHIGKASFQNCINLSKLNGDETGTLVIPSTIAYIEESSFYGCRSFKQLDLPQNLNRIGMSAFEGCAGLTDVVVPDSVHLIEIAAFRNCSSLKNITIPFIGKSKLSTENESVFGYIFGQDWYNGTGNESGFVNRQFGEVNGGTWQYTGMYEGYMRSFFYYIPQSLKAVTITDQTNIPTAAFNGCTMLEEITFKQNITDEGEAAFQNCSATINK